MSELVSVDRSHGYDAVAELFMHSRLRSIGPDVVCEWCKDLPQGADVLDLGCGFGKPITDVLAEAGFRVYGVDASPAMIAGWKERFPQFEAECIAAEEIEFHGRQFDGVMAWGLLFLLQEDVQRKVIAKAGSALRPGGRFAFTAPRRATRWKDLMTDETSVSMGEEVYRSWLAEEGLWMIGDALDTGHNYYLFSVKD